MNFFYNFFCGSLTITFLILVTSCRTTKPFSCVWQNPLDYAYGNLIDRDSLTIRKIKSFTNYIDSLSENDENQNFLIKSIEEGNINQEIVTTSIVGHTNKTETVRETRKGGFGKYTLENIKGDSLYKILYHDNIDKNYYETYYYNDNKLVYSKIDYKEDSLEQTFYYKEEFYKDSLIILYTESRELIDSKYRRRVSFNLREKGETYLLEFHHKKR
jgi:hypothetical protein